MEAWWHDYYATMIQVIAVLLLAVVVEGRIRTALPRSVIAAGLWLCMLCGGFGVWILSEENPSRELVLAGQWIIGLPTAILVVIVTIGVTVKISREAPAGENVENTPGATERLQC